MLERACTDCGSHFVIHPDEEAFRRKFTFTFGVSEFHAPDPVRCPDCRLRIRTCHRNERFMYRRPSAASGQDIVALIHEEPLRGKPYKVFSYDEWNADTNDFSEFGRDMDFTKSFFDQLADLHKAVPRMALTVVGNENCDFTTGTGYCKNCYLINSSEYSEDCYYGKLFQNCKNSVDCSYLYGSELCYECFSVYDSYACTHLSFSKNCSDCLFSTDLTGCKYCCLCSNLSKKEYHFLNQPLSKEEYEKRLGAFFGSYGGMAEANKQLNEIRKTMVHRATRIIQSDGCSGDHIENSQRCLDCYDVNESQDCRYVAVGVNVKDNYDCSNMYIKPELCLETLGTIEVYGCAYCLYVFHSQNLLYCQYCFSCKDCFGCDGLKRKQYCILNTQYTKQEYEALVPKIIAHMQEAGEWGLFFPPSMSPYGYNESVANEYLPLSEAEALRRGFLWRKNTEKPVTALKTVKAASLPDCIGDVPDEIIEWAVLCEVTGRPFKIVKQELALYRLRNIPLPHAHPDVRYDLRLSLRNPRKLWERICTKCGKNVDSTFDPKRPEIVYCGECYRQTVY